MKLSRNLIAVPAPIPPFVLFFSKDSLSRARSELVDFLLNAVAFLETIEKDTSEIRLVYKDVLTAVEMLHRFGSAIYGLLKIPENIMQIIDSAMDALLQIEEGSKK